MHSLTSYNNGSRLLGWVSHVVAGHTAVHSRLIGGNSRQCERATLHNASLRQAVITADPCECGGRLPTCCDAHQRYRLARVDHNRILHQQFNGWRRCARQMWRLRKIRSRWQEISNILVAWCNRISNIIRVTNLHLPVLLVSLKITLRSGIPHTFLTEAMQL